MLVFILFYDATQRNKLLPKFRHMEIQLQMIGRGKTYIKKKTDTCHTYIFIVRPHDDDNKTMNMTEVMTIP